MPLHTTPDKARCAIIRRDLEGYNRYQAELRYRNYAQRFVLGMRADYAVVDEVHTQRLQDAVDRMVDNMQMAAYAHAYPHALPSP
ncbi:hypothetical protein [Streptomyces parvulus]|uniref:hypothetical protein n=1 Tax=Streptomyces parvulus TaxID=146923 RepID=UPI0037B611C9